MKLCRTSTCSLRRPFSRLIGLEPTTAEAPSFHQAGRRARERRPQLPVLYATGYTASYTAPEKGADVLSKPYREADLLTKLRVLLTAQHMKSQAEA